MMRFWRMVVATMLVVAVAVAVVAAEEGEPQLPAAAQEAGTEEVAENSDTTDPPTAEVEGSETAKESPSSDAAAEPEDSGDDDDDGGDGDGAGNNGDSLAVHLPALLASTVFALKFAH
ncbi:uncharacterized protein LOC125045416 isoform X3 [Penaeus chinensis]|uniref:uncharacterized protein LOC125045416 isoform X3 n=1 Tax=Penaeus chinensis TaxID=139456 RepID=UPI001FB576A1|nr:uncharacterized protein LOC125045416 isoform X3 [Penaeus chinensis]